MILIEQLSEEAREAINKITVNIMLEKHQEEILIQIIFTDYYYLLVPLSVVKEFKIKKKVTSSFLLLNTKSF